MILPSNHTHVTTTLTKVTEHVGYLSDFVYAHPIATGIFGGTAILLVIFVVGCCVKSFCK